MELFKREKTLAELEDEEEVLDAQVSVSRKKALLKSVEARLGKGSWRRFSNNGKKSGLDWNRVWAWLKSN